MNRKHFISSTGSLLAATILPTPPGTVAAPYEDELNRITPSYLREGDLIGITSPAGYVTPESIQPAIQQIESWGLRVKSGSTIGKRDFSFGGTDAERAADFQQLLNDPKIKAILCARGGYGVVRIIDKLNWEKFKLHPKWIIGFSDLTVIHSHLSRNIGAASLHSKMCNSFPEDWSKAEPIQVETILSIKQALMGERMKYSATPNENNRTGKAEGLLVGGNLKTLESLAGSKSDINTAGKILFLEDTGEYLYSLDRMFWNLKRTGKLDKLAALIIGGFKIKPDDPGEEFGRSLYDIVLEKVKSFSYPVCFDFPVGHQKNNFALKCGIRHRLEVNAENSILKEI